MIVKFNFIFVAVIEENRPVFCMCVVTKPPAAIVNFVDVIIFKLVVL